MVVWRTNYRQVVGGNCREDSGGCIVHTSILMRPYIHKYTCSGDANVLASPPAQNQLLDGLRGHLQVFVCKVRLINNFCVTF